MVLSIYFQQTYCHPQQNHIEISKKKLNLVLEKQKLIVILCVANVIHHIKILLYSQKYT